MRSKLYCNRWNRIKRLPGGSLPEEEARRRYDKREPFCLVVYVSAVPIGYVEFGRDSIGVGFLDENLRPRLDRAYDNRETGLFLAQEIEMKYANQSSMPDETIHRITKHDGSTTTRVLLKGKLVREEHTTSELGRHWATIPRFDNLDSLLTEPLA